jgi:AcrR family transcriptional regulator
MIPEAGGSQHRSRNRLTKRLPHDMLTIWLVNAMDHQLELPARERILRSAERLFAAKGFDGTRVDEIAADAGVNKALIYHYFENKRALLDLIVGDFIRKAAQILMSIAFRGYAFDSPEAEAVMQRYRDFMEERRDVLKIMMIESIKGDEPTSPMFNLVDIPVEEGFDEEAVVADLQSRGFGMDQDRQQRMVTEFFTGVMPDVCLAIFREKWCHHFGIAEEELDAMYQKAIDETHSEHHRRT